MKMGSSQWQRIRSKCRPVLRVLLHELWPASPWKTMGYTWLWLFWCVFPGTMVLKYSMDPGDHIMMIMIGGGILLLYGSVQGIVEAINLSREGIWEFGELFLIFIVSLPPLLIGGALSFMGVVVFMQKILELLPQG